MERLRVPFLLTTRAAAFFWGLTIPRRTPATVPLELAVPHPPPAPAPAPSAGPPRAAIPAPGPAEPLLPGSTRSPSVSDALIPLPTVSSSEPIDHRPSSSGPIGRRAASSRPVGQRAASASGVPKADAPRSTPAAVSPRAPAARPSRDDPPLLRLLPEDITSLGGRRLTTLERTAYDCARSLPRYEALALVDQSLARGASLPALLARARRAAGPGSTQARAVIAMADPAAQSPGESLVRGVLIDTGFPRPTCQLPAPPTPYRLDLGHARYLCALEYDGEAHHTGRAHRSHDTFRRTRLASHGWRVLPVTRDFRTTPAPYLHAWLTLLLESGWSPTPTHLSTLTRRIRTLRLPLRLLHPNPPPPPSTDPPSLVPLSAVTHS
ncbi:hypothetical protein GCM10009550_09760 [Actinocorallia libanotica]|uniref:DUF559 domain-containing protein n=1 Tax=Actinocorallia libanotica TaxID=46162 RepID=A0ABP4ARQ6_9ACTN